MRADDPLPPGNEQGASTCVGLGQTLALTSGVVHGCPVPYTWIVTRLVTQPLRSLAAMEGADPARVSMLCVLHDTQETRITDIPHIAKRYLTAVPNTAVTADQVAACPPAVADVITAAVAEYEAGETRDAVVARDADKLECLVQAVEYRHQGIDNVQRWIDSSRAALTTTSAHRLADAALAGQPLAWLTPPLKPE